MNALTPDRDAELDVIRAELVARADEVALTLLGQPNRRLSSRREWRWGRKGSLSLELSGAKRGLCFDHDANEGGDLLWMARRERGGDFLDTLAWARDFLRLPETASRAAPPRRLRNAKREAEAAKREAEHAADVAKRIARARAFAAEAVPADGTPADTYLTKWRRIPRPAGGWPDAVRYHRGRNALLVVATDDAGEVRAVQLVHLAPDAQKLTAEEAQARGLPAAKVTYGYQEGAAVRLPGSNPRSGPDVLALAEGPETGLSVWSASGLETWIALGSIAKIAPPAGRRLVVCADDDPRHHNSHKSRRKAIREWRENRVFVAMPWSRRRHDRTDFNDAIREDGAEAVAIRVHAALPARVGDGTDGRLPADEAREQLRRHMEAFFAAARGFDADDPDAPLPVTWGIGADVGLGKSALSRLGIVRLLTEMRLRRDKRAMAIAVPTHALGDEQARDFNKMPGFAAGGFLARVWRGRLAPDPDAPDFHDPSVPKDEKTKMCRDPDAVRDAQFLALDADTTVCRSKKGECPFYASCAYQQAKQESADVWIVPHELLYSRMPAALGKIALLVVDEAAWQDGLYGVDGHPMDLALDAFDTDVVVPDDRSGVSTARLRDVHRLARAAMDAHADGNLRRDAILAAGLDASTAHDGRVLSFDRIVNPGIVPGMPAEERRALVKAAAGNRTAFRLAQFFEALEALLAEHGPDASGRIVLAHKDTDDGPVRVVRLRGVREVRKGWRVPTLLIDALLDPALVRPYWPDVEVRARIAASTPHMRVRQVVGRDFTTTGLVPDERQSRQENRRRLRHSRKVRAAVLREARRTAGRVLVVAQKVVREFWESLGCIPRNVEWAHHNAVAGRDEWGPQRDESGNLTDPGVALLIVVGRTQAPPGSVERMAEALTGRALGAKADGWYDRVAARITKTDGWTEAAEADRHPDPVAEAIRRQICEGELIQIIGRVRGVNRTAANPVEVLVLTDRPLPIPVDETVPWDGMAPTLDDQMLSEGGVILKTPADAARAYADFWDGSEEKAAAAKKARQRDGDHSAPARRGTSPYRESPFGECPPPPTLATICYQRRGRGCKPAEAQVDLALVPDPKAWLEQRLGPMAWCDVDLPEGPETDPPPPEPPAPRPRREPQEPAAEAEPQAPLPEPDMAELADALAVAGLAAASTEPSGDLMRLIQARAGDRPVVADVVTFDAPGLMQEEAARIEEEERQARIAHYARFVESFLAVGPSDPDPMDYCNLRPG